MLENKELKYVLTTEDGKIIAGYSAMKDAETDADDICKEKKNKKFHIYSLSNSSTLGDTILQKTYELKTTYPLPEPESKEDDSEKKEEEGKTEDKKE